jgi:ClpP class serine protease
MQLGLQERDADQQVLVGRPVRKRWDRDISVEIVQYFAAVFVQAVKSRRGGETDRLKVLEEQADLGRGRAAGSAHRVIDAGDRADVVNSACQWLHPVILPGGRPRYAGNRQPVILS